MSPWATTVHLVSKGSGEWRPCWNYHLLNNKTLPDRYPLPHLQDFISHLAGDHIFLKVDLLKAFHQILVALEDIEKTTMMMLFGLFKFTKMPFRLQCCPDVPVLHPRGYT